MITAEADIRTEHAARYLARLCGHAVKMGTAGRRMGHRRPSHAPGDTPPEVRRVECSGTEGTVSLDCGQWTMRAFPGRLAVRAVATATDQTPEQVASSVRETGDLGQWPEPAGVVAPFEREMHDWFGTPAWFPR